MLQFQLSYFCLLDLVLLSSYCRTNAEDQFCEVSNKHTNKDHQVSALILARGGSKGIIKKNLIKINGKTLIERALSAIHDSGVFQEVWVSTDDEEIAQNALSGGARIHRRSADFALDNSTSIDAVREFLLAHNNINHIALIQCTSVFLKSYQLEIASSLYKTADCVFAATKDFKLRWTVDEGSYVKPLNFNPKKRPRRQDWNGELIETGMFYFVSRHLILENDVFQNERCKIVAVPPEDSLEIDTHFDLKIAKCLQEH